MYNIEITLLVLSFFIVMIFSMKLSISEARNLKKLAIEKDESTLNKEVKKSFLNQILELFGNFFT